MMPDNHPDPFGDALQQGVQRAIQLASGAVTAAQVYLFHRNTQARAVDERADGLGPAEAMQEAAPLFARPAHAHDAAATPRPMVTVGEGLGESLTETGHGPPPGGLGELPGAGLVIAEQ